MAQTAGATAARPRFEAEALRWERRLRALWFRLQLLLGRLRHLLRDGGARAFRRGRRRTDAEATGGGTADPGHPGLRRLRRRALDELFEWLDLPLVPGQLLKRSDETGRPVEAFEELVRSLGGEPEQVRRRDPEALKRLAEAIDLLASFDFMAARFDARRRVELEQLLYFGDHALVRRLTVILETLDGILADADGLRPDLLAAPYQAFLADLRGYLEQPLALSPERAKRLQARAEVLLRLQRRNELLTARIAGDLERLLAGDSTTTASRAGEIAEQLAELEGRWTGEPGLDEAGLEAILAELEKLQQRLAGLLEEQARDSRRRQEERQEKSQGSRYDSKHETEQVYRTEREAALAFFGFAVTDKPETSAVKRARSRFFKDHHPDFFTDPEVKAQKTAVCQEANRHYEVLRRELGL